MHKLCGMWLALKEINIFQPRWNERRKKGEQDNPNLLDYINLLISHLQQSHQEEETIVYLALIILPVYNHY